MNFICGILQPDNSHYLIYTRIWLVQFRHVLKISVDRLRHALGGFLIFLLNPGADTIRTRISSRESCTI